MSNVRIRAAQAADASAIAAIEELCFAVPWSLEAILQELTQNPRALYLVAEQDGQVIGYVGVWLILDEGHITNVAVRPEYRRQGIAVSILQRMLEVTEKAGILHHTLEVRRSNQAAIALYEGLGFETGGVRKGYYQDNGEDALIMWRQPQPL